MDVWLASLAGLCWAGLLIADLLLFQLLSIMSTRCVGFGCCNLADELCVVKMANMAGNAAFFQAANF